MPANNTTLASSIASGTNIKFLNGTQRSLNTLLTNGGATEGAFYLTSDTHRLYVGQKESNAAGAKVIPVPVNQGVTTVATVKDLSAEAGAFYYVESENILCVYNGTEWVQINPDTNTYVSDITYTVNTANGVATITTIVKQQGNGTNGSGTTKSDSVKIKGADGITVSSSDKEITITGDTYSLSSDANSIDGTIQIKLDSSSTTNDSSVTFKPGDSNTTLTKDASGNVVITSKNAKINTVEIGNGSSKTDTAKDKEGFYVRVADSEGNAKQAPLDPLISINGNSVHFINGTATLDVYDKSQIDEKMRALDAVVYKGLLFATPANTNVQNGALYLIGGKSKVTVTNGDGTSFEAAPGDMIIARGTEGADGFIPSSGVVWDYIPSANDAMVDTTYVGSAVDNGMSIKGKNGTDAGSVIAKFVVQGDDTYLTTTDSATSASDKINTVTISHKEIAIDADGHYKDDSTATAATNVSSFDIVTGLTRDAAGHVSGVTKQNISIDNSAVSGVSYTATAASNVATVKNTVTTKTKSGISTSKEGSFTIGSSTLNVTASGSAVTMDLCWGTF